MVFIGDDGEKEESVSVEIPRQYHLKEMRLAEEFDQGRCKISVPATQQGLF